MQIYNYNQFAYFHDALFMNLFFEVDIDGLRQCRITINCDEECGYAPWAGRTLELLFIDVLLCKGSFWGYVAGPEYFDHIRQGISPDVYNDIGALINQGIKEPKMQVTVVLQSGSEFVLACDRIEVNLLVEG